MNARSETNTRLRGKWLLIARPAWAAMFTVLTVMYALGFLEVRQALSTVCEEELCTLRQQFRHTEAGDQVMDWGGPPIGFADPPRPDQIEALAKLGVTLNQFGWLGALQMGLPALVYLLIAAGLFWRKSDDWMVLFISTVVMTSPLVDMPLPYTLAVRQPFWQGVHTAAHFLAVSSWFTWPLVFPTGQFVPRWTRWKIFFDIAFAFTGILHGSSILRKPPGWGNFEYIYILLSISINVYALSYRYFRVASPVQRQQIKWVFVGLMAFITIAFVSLQFDFQLISQAGIMDPDRALLLSLIPDTLYRAVALFIPVSIAISVLRYRLWDIDVIISRALVYSTLTAIITGLYILVVGSLSSLMQNRNDVAAIAVALLVVAALFQPLRRNLQTIVNRLLRFDPGKRNEFQEALQSFSEPSTEAQEENVQTQEITEADSSPHTSLHGRWLLLARLAWVIMFLTLIAMYAFGFLAVREALSTVCEEEPCTLRQGWPGPPIGYAEPLHPDQVRVLETHGLTLDWYGWLGALQMGLPLLVYLLIAAGLFWKKSDEWMVLFASLMVATIPIANVPLPFVLAARQPPWQWVNDAVGMVSLSLFLIFPLIFPTGQIVPRWTRWLVLFDIVFAVIMMLYGNSILEISGARNLIGGYVLISLGIGVYAQLCRYFRVARPTERLQIKWVIVGLAGFISIAFAVLIPLDALLTSRAANLNPTQALLLSVIPDTFFQLILLFIPVSIAISVLRYRLWDIGIIINRTLVYSVLTASVVTLYVFIVGWSSIGLQTQNNLAGSIFAILVIAFLFRPLRRRVQRIADRFVPVPQTALPVEQYKDKIAIPQSAADTRLRGRWLLIARLAWAIIFLTLTAMYALGFLAVHDVLSTVCEAEPCTLDGIRHTEAGDQILGFMGPPIGYADRLRSAQVKALETLNLTLDQYSWLGALQMGIPLLIYLLIAAGLFWRKSDDWMVLFVSTMIMTFPAWGNAAALYSGSAPARLAVGICTGFLRIGKHFLYLSAHLLDRATGAALDALEDIF